MNRTIPQPGWIAWKLMDGGTAMALCLVGMAITMNNGQASDDEISESYLALAADYDPIWTMNEYYIGLEAQYPFLIGHLNVITSWMQNGTEAQTEQVARYAQLLSTVSFMGAEAEADGDLLGPLIAHFAASGHKRSGIIDYLSVHTAMLDIMMSGPRFTGGDFIDTWCGPGTRAIAASQLMTMAGQDPAKVQWYLNDPNPMAVACAGLNMVANQIGPHVHLHNRTEFARYWLATRGRGAGRLLPDEERKRVLSD